MDTMKTYTTYECLVGVQSWELPWRHEIKLTTTPKGRYLQCRKWEPYSISIRGESSKGYSLHYVGWARITKRDEVGRMSRNLMDGGSASEAIYRAYSAWVSAGKPDEFLWTE